MCGRGGGGGVEESMLIYRCQQTIVYYYNLFLPLLTDHKNFVSLTLIINNSLGLF